MKPVGLVALLVSSLLPTALCADFNAMRAKSNYQILCQGCHTPDGSGGRGVPRLTDSIGRFLSSQEGREYIIRVPGSANSPLDSDQLAELINWSIEQFAGESLPASWQHYSADEVAEYRKKPLFEVFDYRAKLLDEPLAKDE
ncbi:c-type cytochrome [Granulosicoccus antarcticus]|uniref:c-type cytochrome n=1 Tax=Granulosicoccus antarcticus TaxID=437505 RepID=UPI00197AF889|nr:hypothetical protein [Granulosicoccus antarcticus]